MPRKVELFPRHIPMLIEFWRVGLSSVAAVLLGGRAVRFALREQPGSIQNGPWRTDPHLSSIHTGIYTRARAARHAPYALGAPEAIYFVSTTDSQGNPLRRGCTYRIQGRDPDTRWWSVAAYSKNRLIPNTRNRYSFSKTNIKRHADGTWTVVFSPREQPENWLPGASENGRLKLVFRCYGPGTVLLEHPETVALPSIERGIA
jgi:hypothetical protein